MSRKHSGVEKYFTREECDYYLEHPELYTDATGRLSRSIAWHDAVEDEKPWAIEVIKKSRKRNQKRTYKSLGKLKRGQVYVVQWPRTDWINGYPSGWGKWQGVEPADRWRDFLKDNPVRLYCSTWCFPPEMLKLQEHGGSGMAWKATIRWAYELAGVLCAGCGQDLAESKGGMLDQRRKQARKTRVRKPTKPRGLVTLAQVRKQMAEEAKRIERMTRKQKPR